jgi:hypothetical protein
MQADRSAAVAAVSGSVRGLGVCDAFHVRLDAIQRAPLARALDGRIAALADGDIEDALERGEERRLLMRMRAQLPESATGAFALVGPAGLVLAVVHACLVEAVDALARGLGDGPALSWSAELARAAAAAAAWIATTLDCRAVERFSFDVELEPGHAW